MLNTKLTRATAIALLGLMLFPLHKGRAQDSDDSRASSEVEKLNALYLINYFCGSADSVLAQRQQLDNSFNELSKDPALQQYNVQQFNTIDYQQYEKISRDCKKFDAAKEDSSTIVSFSKKIIAMSQVAQLHGYIKGNAAQKKLTESYTGAAQEKSDAFCQALPGEPSPCGIIYQSDDAPDLTQDQM